MRFLNSTEVGVALDMTSAGALNWLNSLAELEASAVDWERLALAPLENLNFKESGKWRVPENLVPFLADAAAHIRPGVRHKQALLMVLGNPETTPDPVGESTGGIPAQVEAALDAHLKALNQSGSEFLERLDGVKQESLIVLQNIQSATRKADEVRRTLDRHLSTFQAATQNLDVTAKAARDASSQFESKLDERLNDLEYKLQIINNSVNRAQSTAGHLHQLVETAVGKIQWVRNAWLIAVGGLLGFALAIDGFPWYVRLFIVIGGAYGILALGMLLAWLLDKALRWLSKD